MTITADVVTRYGASILSVTGYYRINNGSTNLLAMTMPSLGAWESTTDIAGQTGWGLVNAVTEYADHHKRARSQGNRLDNAWFGPTANIKDAVFHEVLELTS